MGQLEVLRVLVSEARTMRSVQNSVNLQSSSVHYSLRQLMKKGLIEKIRQPLIVYEITEKGRKFLEG